MWRDLSHAARRLARSPGFAVLAALTLSLGIGVNAALFNVLDALLIGATAARLRREVLASGVRHGFAGVAVGLLATFGTGQLFSAYVSRLGRFDPAILAALAIALVAVTVLASLVPAWRATRVDPVEALRCD